MDKKGHHTGQPPPVPPKSRNMKKAKTREPKLAPLQKDQDFADFNTRIKSLLDPRSRLNGADMLKTASKDITSIATAVAADQLGMDVVQQQLEEQATQAAAEAAETAAAAVAAAAKAKEVEEAVRRNAEHTHEHVRLIGETPVEEWPDGLYHGLESDVELISPDNPRNYEGGHHLSSGSQSPADQDVVQTTGGEGTGNVRYFLGRRRGESPPHRFHENRAYGKLPIRGVQPSMHRITPSPSSSMAHRGTQGQYGYNPQEYVGYNQTPSPSGTWGYQGGQSTSTGAYRGNIQEHLRYGQTMTPETSFVRYSGNAGTPRRKGHVDEDEDVNTDQRVNDQYGDDEAQHGEGYDAGYAEHANPHIDESFNDPSYEQFDDSFDDSGRAQLEDSSHNPHREQLGESFDEDIRLEVDCGIPGLSVQVTPGEEPAPEQPGSQALTTRKRGRPAKKQVPDSTKALRMVLLDDFGTKVVDFAGLSEEGDRNNMINHNSVTASNNAYSAMVDRGMKEIQHKNISCVECQTIGRNRNDCNLEQNTREACWRCLNRKTPCGRMIRLSEEPALYGVVYFPVPEKFRDGVSRAELAHWALQDDTVDIGPASPKKQSLKEAYC